MRQGKIRFFVGKSAKKVQKSSKKKQKSLDKRAKKWYHILYYRETYARFRFLARKRYAKKDFSNRSSKVLGGNLKQSEVLCYEKVQQSSCNGAGTHHCSGNAAYQCDC